MTARTAVKRPYAPELDRFLLVVAGILLAGGLVMLTSASISVAERTTGNPFFYLEKQLLAVALGLLGLLIVTRIPTSIWERLGLLLAY
jgi:cell division protein FtsW